MCVYTQVLTCSCPALVDFEDVPSEPTAVVSVSFPAAQLCRCHRVVLLLGRALATLATGRQN